MLGITWDLPWHVLQGFSLHTLAWALFLNFSFCTACLNLGMPIQHKLFKTWTPACLQHERHDTSNYHIGQYTFTHISCYQSIICIILVECLTFPKLGKIWSQPSRQEYFVLALFLHTCLQQLSGAMAWLMPGQNVQVHYVHSNILTQSERPL